jgi:hypothetical protein
VTNPLECLDANFPIKVMTLSARSQKRLARASLVGSFDRAFSSGSLAFAAYAVCLGDFNRTFAV